MTDPIDEYMVSMLRKYKDYEFINIASSDAKMPELEGEDKSKKELEKTEKEHKNFLAFVSTTIGKDSLEKVSF
jgi:HSP90 family molecular chaperone